MNKKHFRQICNLAPMGVLGKDDPCAYRNWGIEGIREINFIIHGSQISMNTMINIRVDRHVCPPEMFRE